MKTTLRVLSFLLMLLALASEPGMAQQFTDPATKDPGYDAAKRLARRSLAGKRSVPDVQRQQRILAAGAQLKASKAVNNVIPCFLPIVPASTAIPRSDDGSFGPIQLPFDFKLYGTVYNQVWINTNGNLTFTGPYGAHTAAGFPVSGQPMVAPFWGDVDTRDPASGQVYYMLGETELIVTWDKVGYNGGTDKTNTFQVIIGSEESSYFYDESNVGFYYGDMQWATAGGFGGAAATVGANKGDGTQYFQAGRFSEPGIGYDGPGGNNDGVDYLDNQCIAFNASEQQNISPTVLGMPYMNYVEMNLGDTSELDLHFLGPEAGQQVTVSIDTTGFCNVHHVITNGAMASARISIAADSCNAGFHYMEITATDNGNPAQTTSLFLMVHVKAERKDQTISFPTPVDPDGNGRMGLHATASSGLPVSYFILSGSAYVNGDDSLIVEGGGEITIRAYQMGDGIYNYAEKDLTICVPLRQPGKLYGDTVACIGTTKLYDVQAHFGANVNWSLSGGGTLEIDANTVTVHWTSVGKHTLTTWYTSACTVPGPVRTYEVEVTNPTLTGAFTNLRPVDNHSGIDFPITFSWSPITGAKYYDLYVWPDTADVPEMPLVSNVTNINFTLYGGYEVVTEYGRKYKWQVRARNVCDTLEGPVQTFTLRKLPDLIVENIQVPPTGFSGQPFSLRWEVKNTGEGETLTDVWYDKLYLSRDKVLDAFDLPLDMVENMTTLKKGESYANTATVTLPNGLNDKFYVIVVANDHHLLTESDTTNNLTASITTSTIELTPPPDLQVSSVVPPTIAFSGQSVQVMWTVVNKGPGTVPHSSWTDKLYLSKSEILNTDSAIELDDYTQWSELNAGAEYTQSVLLRIPDTISGTYYLHVVTDALSNVYEHAAENNNLRTSDSIKIVPKPPVDLVVPQITIPATANNGESITVNWRVENAGGASTEYYGWRDKVYLSKSAVLNEKEALSLGEFGNLLRLAPGEGYNHIRSFKVPAGITGAYYVHVKTDVWNAVFEYDYENNNTAVSPQPLAIQTPDLVVSQLGVAGTAASGTPVSVSWTVKNTGTGQLYSARIKDRILLSREPVFEEAKSTLLKEIVYATGELPAGGDTMKQASVVIPPGIAGPYYLYVQTDSSNVVYEVNEDNNVLRSTAPITITLSPWTDLRVTGVHVADTATAAGLMDLQYTVVNKGERATDTSWKDRVYVSRQAQWDTAGSVLLQEIPHLRRIGKDSSFAVNVPVTLPGQVGDSTYYFYVVANADKTIYEHTDSVNNITRSGEVFVKRYPPVDLAVMAVSAPAAAKSGTPVTIKWAVKNEGNILTLPTQWYDGVYLSADTEWDGGDRLVKEFIHRGALPAGAGYADEQTVVMPNGVSGRYYLMLVTDHRKTMLDADTTNNYELVRPGGGTTDPLPMDIELTPPANLVVGSLKVPATGIAGQPVRIEWKVQNTGVGTTAAGSWTERIYLSEDMQVDTTDKVLATYTRTGALAPGAAYDDSLLVYLPSKITGNYIVLFKADAQDHVYEHGAEENLASQLIEITQAPLTDLVVTSITVPDSVVAGEKVTINWTLKNTGIHEMRGYMQEGIYLSADTVKDANDIVVEVPHDLYHIPAQSSIDRRIVTELTGLSLQGYYVLVHTDIRNNVAESNDDNNQGVSARPMQVKLETLPLQVVKQAVVPAKRSIYYRIDIPDSLAGQSLLITLKGDSLQGSNELFLRHAGVPDRAVHDHSAAEPFLGNQELIVPALQRGSYYLMVYGSTVNNKPQPVQVLASILQFEVRAVDAAKGGNTGLVTIQVKGSKLGAVTKLRLRSGGRVIPSDHINKVNATSLFARFNLEGATLGIYDVVAENNAGDTAVLKGGFTVEAGSAAQLITSVEAPLTTRPSNMVVLRVQFRNAGNTDLVSPELKLTSLGGAPIAFDPEDLENPVQVLTLHPRELNAPAGILRPGASGTILVYAKATTVLGFTLVQPGL